MNRQKFVDWLVIAIFLICIFGTTTIPQLWEKTTYIAPLYIFVALSILFLNHISLKECFYTKDREFFLMSGGILLSGINIILIHSRIGAFFTIADFLLLLYLANKIYFQKIQLGVFSAICFFILFYWLFINKTDYLTSSFNPNGVSIILLIYFCVSVCYLTYLISSHFRFPKWGYYVAVFLSLIPLTIRVLSFHCRGVLLGILVWALTYFILPKKKYTIYLVIGTSLLMPMLYVLLWKSDMLEGLTFLGKRIASGRDIIWYEFFQAFIQHPITGIGSDFERMVPDLYLKEVHHSLLDLLFVHGTPVFLIVLYLLYKRISEIITNASEFVKATCLASIYGLITAGSLENYYIVSPFNILFLTIFIISNTASQEQQITER